ncbi:helix-turn-helix domain-containing protein [Dietzia cercidiphylli]|uniref:helix-turn-helix domain-containing protein n=1 Tax=Dietzia cercidiphylli TaxID=498199 RepID=UPI00223B4F85|nr:helix-turn-helix transcriptional regulator [Dietzia cercidiphylli]MCT1517138.1 helix-turn-helix domain-containing protein [Dietzia cercidiphylli]
MTPDEARSLGRAIRTVRTERGLTQMKLAHAVGISNGLLGNWERGTVSAARGKPAHPPTITREHLETLAAALDCTPAEIADRAALTPTTRLLYGLDPLGPARTVVGGRHFDLTDAEADRVADFIAGLIAARSLT